LGKLEGVWERKKITTKSGGGGGEGGGDGTIMVKISSRGAKEGTRSYIANYFLDGGQEERENYQ